MSPGWPVILYMVRQNVTTPDRFTEITHVQ